MKIRMTLMNFKLRLIKIIKKDIDIHYLNLIMELILKEIQENLLQIKI